MPRLMIFLVLACLTGSVLADQKTETQQQLKAAGKDIEDLSKRLDELGQEKSAIYGELRQSERDMGQLQKQIGDLEKLLTAGRQELDRLQGKKQKLQQSSKAQERLIAIQARAAYQSGGRQEYLKLLLNQQNPQSFSRTLTYYDYLVKARLQQIGAFNQTLQELADVEQGLSQEAERLSVNKQQLDGRRKEMALAQAERKKALAQLDRDLASGDQRLEERRREQAQLNQVLKTIEETLARQAREAQMRQAQIRQAQAQRAANGAIPPLPAAWSGDASASAFAGARGRLPWPVNGRLLARFGAPRGNDPRSTWDGVLIDAPEGTTVRAVYGGRVVFADWLRGAGLLIILDHGNGYLSLYGHTQHLLKSAGDVVKPGEAIATVGSSGGLDMAALYFAIRQQGRPSDPVQWCRAQG